MLQFIITTTMKSIQAASSVLFAVKHSKPSKGCRLVFFFKSILVPFYDSTGFRTIDSLGFLNFIWIIEIFRNVKYFFRFCVVSALFVSNNWCSVIRYMLTKHYHVSSIWILIRMSCGTSVPCVTSDSVVLKLAASTNYATVKRPNPINLAVQSVANSSKRDKH